VGAPAFGQPEQVGVEERLGRLSRGGHVEAEVGADRSHPEALPVDRDDQVALAPAQVGHGDVAVVRDGRQRVVLLEEVLASRPQGVGEVGGAGAGQRRPAAPPLYPGDPPAQQVAGQPRPLAQVRRREPAEGVGDEESVDAGVLDPVGDQRDAVAVLLHGDDRAHEPR
jgi:hypothetical protein